MKLLASPSPALKYRNRSIRLTPEGVLFILLTILVGITAFNTGNNMLYLFFAMMLTLIMLSSALSEWCLKGIRIEHRLPPHIFAQDPVICRWVIRNSKSFFPSFTIKAVPQYPHTTSNPGAFVTRISAGDTHFQTSTLIFSRRGIFQSAGYELTTAFPFGLIEKTLSIPSSGEVAVYPKLTQPWLLSASSPLGDDIQEQDRKGRGSALHNLRDYRQGDDWRNIHWKTSARQSKLMIQEHEKENERRVQIWLSNLPPSSPSVQTAEEFEEAVRLSGTLVHTFSKKGYAVGLSTLHREILPARGMSHCYRILRLLASVELQPDRHPQYRERLAGRVSGRAQRTILVLPFDDPFWKSREGSFTRVITLAQWRRAQTREGVL